MKYTNILFAFLFIAGFTACDEKEVTIPEFQVEDTGRKVLIEEITGVQCPNCPAGAATIEGFKQAFPGRIVSVAYHSYFLASPLADSQYDFRSDEAQAFEELIGVPTGKPSAAINRVQFSDQSRIWLGVIDLWGAKLQEVLNEPSEMNLQITNTFNSDTRELNVDVRMTPLVSKTDNYALTVMILENNIIDPQLDQATEIEEYEHDHIFHKLLSDNVSGDAFATTITEGIDIVKSYDFTVPTMSEENKAPWIAENLEVVAFITNDEGIVMQAEKADVMQ